MPAYASPMRWIAVFCWCAAAMPLAAASTGSRQVNHLEVVEGYTAAGAPNDRWLTMIGAWWPDGVPQQVLAPTPLTAAGQAWADLIRARAKQWESEIEPLARDFGPISPPQLATIVIGPRGGRDAFTHAPSSIGFDVSQLQAVYGDAALEENRARIDRFFRHEYVHLLQKGWLGQRGYDASTPLRAALLGIWMEGLGNYYSLSPRWRSMGGQPSRQATETLTALTPRFVARLAALSCGTEASRRLIADLSEGPFDQKWGALPAALWLEIESAGSDGALSRFVLAGPEGVWALADRHLGTELRASLAETRASAGLCSEAPESSAELDGGLGR